MNVMGLRIGLLVGITMLAGGGFSAAGAMAGEGCPNAALRTGPSAGLPDCRAYEQVSPVGGTTGVLGFDSKYLFVYHEIGSSFWGALQAVPDGSAITYYAQPPGKELQLLGEDELENEVQVEQFASVRSAEGWRTVAGGGLSPEELPGPEEVPVPAAPFPGARVLEETEFGSRVFFLDEEHEPGITENSNAATGEPDLYEYDVPAQQLVDMTPETVGHTEHADVQGIVDIGGEGSEAGSRVYVVAHGVLAANANSEGARAVPGADNLYVLMRHAGEEPRSVTFIATLSPEDEAGQQAFGGFVGAKYVQDWPVSPSARTAEVSPNGRYLAFSSHAGLTGQAGGEPEIYRYDSEGGSLMCVSCSPAGGTGPGALDPPSPRATLNGENRQRYMLDDGRVFFTTTAGLVPADVNGQADVYEWEDGAAQLISGGTPTALGSEGEEGSVFAEASADGGDVFFTTSQSLVPTDQDEVIDIYDAREDGGFPAPAVACPLDEACPGASEAPPAIAGVPASSTFAGTEAPPAGESTPASPPVRPRKPKPRSLTRAQKLARALRECRTKTGKGKRGACEAQAGKRYGPIRGRRAGKSTIREGK